MNTLITPDQFMDAFDPVAKREEQQLYEVWWTSAKEYTRRFLSPPTGVIAQVAQNLGFEYRCEKVRMDAMLYRPVNGFHSLFVAVEHENNAESAHHEVWKLSLLNAPLKVLFTYPQHGEENLLLDRYATALRAMDHFNDAATKRRQLVVFGMADESNPSIEWRSYLWGKSGFATFRTTS